MSQPRKKSEPDDDRKRNNNDDEEPREFEDMVDEESAESFPASDPPSFTPEGQYGIQEEEEDEDDEQKES